MALQLGGSLGRRAAFDRASSRLSMPRSDAFLNSGNERKFLTLSGLQGELFLVGKKKVYL